MFDITYCKANSLCADQLAHLRFNMLGEFREIFIIHCRAVMQKYIESDTWICFIAQENNTVIGNVWFEKVDKVPSFKQTSSYWVYVTNMYVVPEYRNRKIGTQLLTYLKNVTSTKEYELFIV